MVGTKVSLSVVLTTFNEADYLADCLDSVKQLADEIIVVDGSSTDKTREIARRFGAKVVKVKNLPMFHTNKQKAVDLATKDWILQLDADEQVSLELVSEVKTAINSDAKFAGYYLPRKNWFLSRFLTKGGQYPDYVIRLFKNGVGHFPQKSVHEQIVIDGPIGNLKNHLIHYADREFSRYLTRFNRYTDLESENLFRAGEKPHLGQAISYLIFKPVGWFLLTYFRHKGFVDGLPGFIFALMSSLRFPVTWFKLWEKTYAR
ncbi:MAG TPA: glycosyltransferase family 2 protein [Patescibacteria group bacterium]|nr:glycosyltransferase family 2 protein [Patescibacteria group bacterium]